MSLYPMGNATGLPDKISRPRSVSRWRSFASVIRAPYIMPETLGYDVKGTFSRVGCLVAVLYRGSGKSVLDGKLACGLPLSANLMTETNFHSNRPSATLGFSGFHVRSGNDVSDMRVRETNGFGEQPHRICPWRQCRRCPGFIEPAL